MSDLLMGSQPLVVRPELAVSIGLNEAIVLQQIQYWLEKSKHKYDGRVWVYNTIPGWLEQFPFWSEKTLKRTLQSLRDKGLVITGNYNKRKGDRTLWYSIEYGSPLLCSSTKGQNDPTIRSDCPHHQVNMTRPLPETTTETTHKPYGQSVGSTPRPGELKESIDKLRGVYQRSMIDDPEPKPNRLDSRENARALAELWNQVIDEHDPNWRKVSTPEILSAKRERTAKQAIKFAKARYKLKHNGTVPTWSDLLDWFTRYLEAAAHHEFHSGYHVSPQYPQGFRRDFDLQLRQSTMEKFVDENNEG